MNGSSIELKSIYDLLKDDEGSPARFFIPAYQRGYRWTPLQVTQLLEDIWDFINPKNGQQRGKFYCLQPIVIGSADEEHFEVVDGQQRLTTILLILRFFNDRLVEKSRKALYTIAFETRQGFDDFLENPTDENASENIDFYHLHEAIEAITDWFEGKDNVVHDIESALLNKTKVIWFQLSEEDDPIAAFTRLNVGKIPLTSDELIRALFLKGTNSDEKDEESRKLRVAYEWDQLEKALQANDFWFFLQNESGWQHNRIRFLFELVAKGRELSHLEREDPHRLFLAFQKWFEEGEKREEHVADTEWARVRDTFMMLEEWFEDRQLFHLVGFLIWKGVNISKIQGIAGSQTKRKFLKSLKRGVFISVFGSGEEVPDFTNAVEVDEFIGDALEELSYGRSSLKIRSVLLLFNIATLLQSKQSNARFQFEEFKAEKWELEHIRSVASAAPDKKREREIFLSDCLGYLRTQGEEELSSQIEAFSNSEEMAEEEREDAFENLYLAILKHFKEDKEEEADNGIGNLTLLDRGTNRGYKNAVFPVKRQYLLSRDEAGIFVPVCTRNVFLKCYNPRVDNLMFWSAEDREAYRKKIQEVLTHFFNESQ